MDTVISYVTLSYKVKVKPVLIQEKCLSSISKETFITQVLIISSVFTVCKNSSSSDFPETKYFIYKFNYNICSLLKGKYLLFQWVWKDLSFTFFKIVQSLSEVLGTQCNRHQSCSLWIHCFMEYSIIGFAYLLQTWPFATYQLPSFVVQKEEVLFKLISTHNRISSFLTHPVPKPLFPQHLTENCCVEEAPAKS